MPLLPLSRGVEHQHPDPRPHRRENGASAAILSAPGDDYTRRLFAAAPVPVEQRRRRAERKQGVLA